MTTEQRIDLAKDQLDRVLGFFGRVDSKASVVLAIDTGMLAYLVAHADTKPSSANWPLCSMGSWETERRTQSLRTATT